MNKWLIMLIISSIVGIAGLIGVVYHVIAFPDVIVPMGIVYSLMLALGFIIASTSFVIYRSQIKQKPYAA